MTSGGRYNCKPWGLPTYKFVLDLGDAIQGGKGTIDKEPFQTSYIRLAELYLIYAEALAETGNNVKALEQINKVRARVGLGKLEVMNPELSLTTNKENLIKEIMRERACELGFEYETRLHDMNRRVMEKTLRNICMESTSIVWMMIMIWYWRNGRKIAAILSRLNSYMCHMT